MFAIGGFYDESRLPPPHSGDSGKEEEDEQDSGWDFGEVLLDNTAYMIDRSNHTTARCPVTTKGGDGKEEGEMRVSFCLAPPPRVSYFCVAYTGRDLLMEPWISATEGNLALISLTQRHGPIRSRITPTNYTYFVYRAPIHGHESPELSRIPDPDKGLFLDENQPYFPVGQVGILRYRTSSSVSTQPAFSPPPPTLTPAPTLLTRRHKHILDTSSDDYDAYKIATLSCYYHYRISTDQYYLYIYDSKAQAWTRKPTAFSRLPVSHKTDTVITIGGTMGWVDLERGIILCDVHVPGEESQASPKVLRYIELPKPLQPVNKLPLCAGTSSFFRDIAVVQGHIKFVDLQIHASKFSLIPNGWSVVTWSMAVTDSGFRKDGELQSSEIVNGLEASLFVAHPTLSSHDDGILYLITKVSLDDIESQVIAVDMKKKMVERVAKFTTQRGNSMDYAYMRTTISKYLTPVCADSVKSKLKKRRGPVLQASSRRQLPAAITSMSKETSGSGYGGGDQVAEGAGDHNPCQPIAAMEYDNMDLE